MQKPTVTGISALRPALTRAVSASISRKSSPKATGPPSRSGYEQMVALLEKGDTLATRGVA